MPITRQDSQFAVQKAETVSFWVIRGSKAQPPLGYIDNVVFIQVRTSISCMVVALDKQLTQGRGH